MFSLVVLLLAVAAVCTVTNGAAPIQVDITCDNILTFYADGVAKVDLNTPGYNNWKTVKKVNIPAETEVVAITCVDNGVVAGILASFSDGTVTDGSWRCTTAAPPNGDWHNADFDDSGWPTAIVSYQNSGSVPRWKVRWGIASKAKWIWTANWDDMGPIDTPVFCRKVLRPQCSNVVPQGYLLVDHDSCPSPCGTFCPIQENWAHPGTPGHVIKCRRSCYAPCPGADIPDCGDKSGCTLLHVTRTSKPCGCGTSYQEYDCGDGPVTCKRLACCKPCPAGGHGGSFKPCSECPVSAADRPLVGCHEDVH